MNGRTILTNGTTSVDGSLYHDYGFIDLEPNYPVVPSATYTASGNTATSASVLPADVIGCRLFLDGAWRNIVAFNNTKHTSCLFTPAVTTAGDYNSPIVTANKIVVTPDNSMTLTKLNFIYQPTFA